MKLHTPFLIFAALLAGFAQAQTTLSPVPAPAVVATSTNATASADMADGEVRKIDKETKKITLKHGTIKSIDMPPMTMVFLVEDTALLDTVKVGDKVRFQAQYREGALKVTALEPVAAAAVK